MSAAQEWQKYEENYLKYGVELRPEETEADRRRKQKAAQKKEQKSKIRVKSSDRVLVLLLIFAVAVCAFMVICLQAMQSDINYRIYTLNQEAENITGEIDNLKVTLNSKAEMKSIESYAVKNLGMTYPDQSQYEYVGDLKGSSEVNDYIESLSEEERGVKLQKDLTPAEAAGHVLP